MIYSLLPFQVYLSICSALSPPRSGASMSPLQRKRRVRDYGSMRLPAAMSPIQSMFHRTCPLMSRVAPPTLSQWFHPCSTYVVPKRAVMCSTYIVPDEHYTIGRCSNYVVSSKPKDEKIWSTYAVPRYVSRLWKTKLCAPGTVSQCPINPPQRSCPIMIKQKKYALDIRLRKPAAISGVVYAPPTLSHNRQKYSLSKVQK